MSNEIIISNIPTQEIAVGNRVVPTQDININNGSVLSVNGQTGAVNLTQDDIPSGKNYTQYSQAEKDKLAKLDDSLVGVTADELGEEFDKSLENYYDKNEVDQKLAHVSTGGSVDLSNYYNKGEVDDKIAGVATDCKLSDAEATYIKKMYKNANYEKFTGSLSMSPSTATYEMGASPEVTFSWEFNKVPTSIVFNNVSRPLATSGKTTLTVTSKSHGTLTYKLVAKYKDADPDFAEETVDSSKSINFYNKYYWGCKPIPAEIDSNFIKGLGNGGWATTKARDFTPTCTAEQYIWYAYPARFKTATMYAGGFEGGFEPVLTVSVTNDYGVTEDYYVYRSTNAGVSLSIQAK